MADETQTLTLEATEDSDDLEVPVALVEMLSEDGETVPEVVGDLAMLGLAQQAHSVVHHSQGEISPQMEAAEELTMDLFEERFGRTYAEVTGHGH
jgi:hypothetical protein